MFFFLLYYGKENLASGSRSARLGNVSHLFEIHRVLYLLNVPSLLVIQSLLMEIVTALVLLSWTACNDPILLIRLISLTLQDAFRKAQQALEDSVRLVAMSQSLSAFERSFCLLASIAFDRSGRNLHFS